MPKRGDQWQQNGASKKLKNVSENREFSTEVDKSSKDSNSSTNGRLIQETEKTSKPSGMSSRQPDEFFKTSEIVRLSQQIIESPKNYNDLVVLVDWLEETIKNGLKDQTIALIQNLVQIFGQMAKKGVLKKEGTADSSPVAQWLQLRLAEFCYKINDIPNSPAGKNSKVAAVYVAAVIKILKIYSIKEGDGVFPKRVFMDFLKAVMVCPHRNVVDIIFSELQSPLSEYDDLRYYFYVQVVTIVKSEEQLSLKQSKRMSNNLVNILLALNNSFPKTNEDLKSFYLGRPQNISKKSLKTGSPFKLSSHQVAFQKCWLQVLRLPQTPQQYKSVLAVLHQKIIPNMIKPQLLLDYLTDSYNNGGSTAILALNGLFSLIQKYNLDYPDFYTKLYALFDSSILYVKYRSRFFRLVDLFLSSTHLPATIVASFIKRISRLALYAPPAAIVACIPFIYNQLKRHPTCMIMIHNPDGVKDMASCRFDDNEPDPLKTNALQSSLWELETLQTHYHPNVASLAKIMSQPFTKPQYILEDFLDHSYKVLMDSEHNRRLKNVPALEFENFDNILEIKTISEEEPNGSVYLKGWCL